MIDCSTTNYFVWGATKLSVEKIISTDSQDFFFYYLMFTSIYFGWGTSFECYPLTPPSYQWRRSFPLTARIPICLQKMISTYKKIRCKTLEIWNAFYVARNVIFMHFKCYLKPAGKKKIQIVNERSKSAEQSSQKSFKTSQHIMCKMAAAQSNCPLRCMTK